MAQLLLTSPQCGANPCSAVANDGATSDFCKSPVAVMWNNRFVPPRTAIKEIQETVIIADISGVYQQMNVLRQVFGDSLNDIATEQVQQPVADRSP